MYDISGKPVTGKARAELPPGPVAIAPALLDWYDRHRRTLPWRALPGACADPYAVWLSEIMLQQTTIAAVKPYFLSFLARWPTVGDLAEAGSEDVMKQWAGLGYYSRARNLHACAKIVAGEHGGLFPDREDALLRLPGVGPYTAAAIAAIAFDRRAVVVDGNVERVISRLFAIEEPLPAAKTSIRAKADMLTPDQRPGDYAQAMMDLGATICTPRRPACALCPLRPACEATASGDAETFPRKTPKAERPARSGAVFFLRRADGAVLVRSRPPKGLLGGMTEIPGTDWTSGFDVSTALQEAPVKASYRRLVPMVEHVFTHFALTLSVFVADVSRTTAAPDGCRWVSAKALDGEAFPSLMRKVIVLAREDQASGLKAAAGNAPMKIRFV
jgi:A/G-specific adenine glycosylase